MYNICLYVEETLRRAHQPSTTRSLRPRWIFRFARMLCLCVWCELRRCSQRARAQNAIGSITGLEMHMPHTYERRARTQTILVFRNTHTHAHSLCERVSRAHKFINICDGVFQTHTRTHNAEDNVLCPARARQCIKCIIYIDPLMADVISFALALALA